MSDGSTLARFRWPLAIVAVVLVVLVAYVLTLRSAERAASGAGQLARDAGQRLGSIAEKFQSGTITETFIAALPEITSAGHGNLELATSKVTETLRRSTERRILWDRISLGETVSEIRVPVTYRYHVQLGAEWSLEVSGRTCIVEAPPLLPTLPPAIHTDGIEKRTTAGWLRFDSAEQMLDLERSLTPTLERYAADRRHMAAAREQSRKTVALFVRDWLLRESHWREDRFSAIQVRFADETEETSEALGPSLTLER